MPDLSGSVKKLYQLLINDPDYQDTPSKSREEVVLGEAVQRAKQHERNNIALSLAKAPLIPSTNGHSNGNGALGKFANFLLKAGERTPRPPGEGLINFSSPVNGITTLVKPLRENIALRRWNKKLSGVMPRFLADLKAIFEGVEVDGEPVNIELLQIQADALEALMSVEVILSDNPNISREGLIDRLTKSEIATFTPQQSVTYVNTLETKLAEGDGNSFYEVVQDERMASVNNLLDSTYDLPKLPKGWEEKCIDKGENYQQLSKALQEGAFHDVLVDDGKQVILDENGRYIPIGDAIITFVKKGLITPGGAARRKELFANQWANLTEALLTAEGRSLFNEMVNTYQGQNTILDLVAKDIPLQEASKIDVAQLKRKVAAGEIIDFTPLQLAAIQQTKRKQDNKAGGPKDFELTQYLAEKLKEQKEQEGIEVSLEEILESVEDKEFEEWGFNPKYDPTTRQQISGFDLKHLYAEFFKRGSKPPEKMMTSAEAQAFLALEEGDITDENARLPQSMQEILEEQNVLKQDRLDAVMKSIYGDDWEENEEENSDIADARQAYQEDPDKLSDDYDDLQISLARDGVVLPDFDPLKILTGTGKEAVNAAAFKNKYYREDFADAPANGWLGQEEGQAKLKDIANRIYTIDGVTEVFLYGASVNDYRFAKEEPEEDSRPLIGIKMTPETEKYSEDQLTQILEAVGVEPETITPTVFQARYYSPEIYKDFKDTIVFYGKDFPASLERFRSQIGSVAGNKVVGGKDEESPITFSDDILNSNLNELLGAEEGPRITLEDVPFQIPLDLAHRLANEVDPDIKRLHTQIDHLHGISDENGALSYAENMDDPIFEFLEDDIFPELRKAFNPDVRKKTGTKKGEDVFEYVTTPVDQATKDEVYRNLNTIFGVPFRDKLKTIKTINYEVREYTGSEKNKTFVASPERRDELSEIASKGRGDIHTLEQEINTEAIDIDTLHPITQQLFEGNILRLQVHRPGTISYKDAINKEIDSKISKFAGISLPNVRKDLVLHDETGKQVPLAILLPSLSQLLGYNEPVRASRIKDKVQYVVGEREKQVNPTVWNMYNPLLIHKKEGEGSGRYRINQEGVTEYIRPQNQGAARGRYLTGYQALVGTASEDEQEELEKNWGWGPDIGHYDVFRDPNTGEPLVTDRSEEEAYGGNIPLHNFLKGVGLNPDNRWISFNPAATIGNPLRGIDVPEGKSLNDVLIERLKAENINGLRHQLPYLAGGRYQSGYEEKQEENWKRTSKLSSKGRDALLTQVQQIESGTFDAWNLGVSSIGSGVGMEIYSKVLGNILNFGRGVASTITLNPEPETPAEVAEAQRQIQTRKEFGRGRPFEFDLTDPDFQTFMKHIFRNATKWEGTFYNPKTEEWGDDIPNDIALSKLVINAKGVEQEVPIGALGGPAAQLLNSLGALDEYKDILEEDGVLPLEELARSYLADNEEGYKALMDLNPSISFERRVFINHFIRKQLEGEVEESWLSEELRFPYGRLLAGLPAITDSEDIERDVRRTPLGTYDVIRAYSDADALRHAEDGNLDIDSNYFDSEDTHKYFINNFKPFKALATHLGKDSVRDLFEEENLVPTTQSILHSLPEDGGFTLVPTKGENKISIENLQTFIRKYMTHSKWGHGAAGTTALRTNKDELDHTLNISEFEGTPSDPSIFKAHEIMPQFIVLTRDSRTPDQLQLRKIFNLGFDDSGNPIYNSFDDVDNPVIPGEKFAASQVKSFRGPSNERKTLENILNDDRAYAKWSQKRASARGKGSERRKHTVQPPPQVSLINFDELNVFLQRNRIGIGVDGEQALQFNTDVDVTDAGEIREWVNDVRSKIVMLRAMSAPILQSKSLTGEDKEYWKSLTGATHSGDERGYRFQALEAALGYITYGEGIAPEPNLTSREPSKFYRFIHPFIGREGDNIHENHKTALGIFKNTPKSYTGTTYQTDLTYQDDMLARIEKTLGNMPESKLQEIFGEHITHANRADPLGVIKREIKKITRRGINAKALDDTFDYDTDVNNEINILLNTVYGAIGPYDTDTGQGSSLWPDQPLPLGNEALIEQSFENMKDGHIDALADLQLATREARTVILNKLRGDQVKIAAVLNEDAEESPFKGLEREVLAIRFGLDIDPETGEQTNRPRSLREAGRELNLSHERINQIEEEALGKLRGLEISQDEHDDLNDLLKSNEAFSKILNTLKPEDVLAGNIDPAIQEQLNAIIEEAAPNYQKYPEFFRKDGRWREFGGEGSNRPFETGRGPVVLGSPDKMDRLPVAPAKLRLKNNQRRNFLTDNLAFSVMIQDVELNDDDPDDKFERYHIRLKEDKKILGHLLRDNGTYSVWRVGDFLESTGGLVDTSAPVKGASPILEGLSFTDANAKIKYEVDWFSPIERLKAVGMVMKHDGVETAINEHVAIQPYYNAAILEGMSEEVAEIVANAGVPAEQVMEIKKTSNRPIVTNSSKSVDPETGIEESLPIRVNKIAKDAVEVGTPKGMAENRLDQWSGEQTIRNRAMKWITVLNGDWPTDELDHALPLLRHLTAEGGYLGLNVQNLMDISDKFVDLGLHGGWRGDGKVTSGSTDHEYSGMSAFLSRLDNLIVGNDVELVKSEKEKNTNNTAFLNKIRGILYEIDLKKDDGTEYSLEEVIPGGGRRDLYNSQVQEATSSAEANQIRTKDTTGDFIPEQIAKEIERLRDPKEFPENQELTTADLRKQAIQTMEKDNKIGGVKVAPWKVSIDTAKAILARVATDEDTDFRKLVESNKIDTWHPWLYLTKTDPETGKQVYNEDFLGMTNDKVKYLFSQLIGEDGQVKHHDSILGHAQSAIEDWTKHNFQAWDKSNYGPRDEEHEQFGKLPRILREHQINDVLDKMAEGIFGETDDIQLSNKEIYGEHMAEFKPTIPEIVSDEKVQPEVAQPEVQPEVQPEATQGEFDLEPIDEQPTEVDPIEEIVPTSAWDALSGDEQKALGKLNQTKASFDVLDSDTQQSLKAYVTPPEDTDTPVVAAGVGGDGAAGKPPTTEGVLPEEEPVPSVEPTKDPLKVDDHLHQVMAKRFGDDWEGVMMGDEVKQQKARKQSQRAALKRQDSIRRVYAHYQDDNKALMADYKREIIEPIMAGDVDETPEVELENLREKYRETYRKFTTSARNPSGTEVDEDTIPPDAKSLTSGIVDLQLKMRVASEQARENEERTRANDLSSFMPEGGIPEGLSARVIKQLARKAVVHQGKYDVTPDSKGKSFMDNESKVKLMAFWEDIKARTDAQGNPLVTFDEIKAEVQANDYDVTYTNKKGEQVRGHALEKVIDEEDAAMEQAEANHKALVNQLNEEGLEALNYPINGHNILISADGKDEMEFGEGGEFTHHIKGRNRDSRTGNLLDQYGEKRIMQAPKVFGLNFAAGVRKVTDQATGEKKDVEFSADEDRIRFNELWNNYYQISNAALHAQRGKTKSGYSPEAVADAKGRQQALEQEILENYAPKGFKQSWLKAARAADQHGSVPIKRNTLGFPIDEGGNPIELPKVIDPETGDEVEGWYSPALHAVVNERHLRTLFQESTKHKTNPLYGDHQQIKIAPTDLRRRGAGKSVGANLQDINDPRLQLIQPLKGSPLESSPAIWLTREGGIYHVPSLEEYSPPAKGPIDSAAFRRLALMHKVADEMAQNPQAFTGQMANLSGYSGMQQGPLDAQQWAGDQEAMANTPTVKRMVRNSPSAKQTIKEQTDNLQASPTARFLASLGGYTKETAGRMPIGNIFTALARDTIESITGKRKLIPATQSQKNAENYMAGERQSAETMRERSELAQKLGMLDPALVEPRDPKEKQLGVGEFPQPPKHPFEEFKPEYIPEVESPLAPVGSAVGALGRFARRKREPKSESIAPPPSMPVEEQ